MWSCKNRGLRLRKPQSYDTIKAKHWTPRHGLAPLTCLPLPRSTSLQAPELPLLAMGRKQTGPSLASLRNSDTQMPGKHLGLSWAPRRDAVFSLPAPPLETRCCRGLSPHLLFFLLFHNLVKL